MRKKSSGLTNVNFVIPRGMFFENIPSWMASSIILVLVQELPGRFGDLKDQVERAALSITNNIAEGCGKLQASEKNGRHLFACAQGSAFETYNMTLQSPRLFQSDISPSYRRLLGFCRMLFQLIALELTELIDAPKLAFQPETIGVFKENDITFFRGVLEAVDKGERIRSLLLKAFAEKKTSLVPEKAENLFQCHVCKKNGLAKSAGKIIKLKVTSRFSSMGIMCRLFFCKTCLIQNGTPIEDYEGVIRWSQKKSRKLAQNTPQFAIA